MKKILCGMLGLIACVVAGVSDASILIKMSAVNNNGHGRIIGTVRADDTIYGLLLTPNLRDLPPGVHGWQIHTQPLCSNYGMAAGGHLDPTNTKQHLGPYNSGHLGDLPVLIVDEEGRATLPVLAPRLKLDTIEGHSLLIHEGEDNYLDRPDKNGVGGARIACGVIGYAH